MGRNLTLKIYEITSHLPKEEVYGMTSQIKRAALSVPANVAEGFGRFHCEAFPTPDTGVNMVDIA